LGITAGYHRLFAHRAYEANWITRVFMLFAGSGALEGSVKWWCGQ
jgi:stearoyl-CoA desaturase (delta-9 desaturase)